MSIRRPHIAAGGSTYVLFDVGFMSTDGRCVVAVGRFIIPPRAVADAGRHIVRRRGVSHSEDNMSCRRQGH